MKIFNKIKSFSAPAEEITVEEIINEEAEVEYEALVACNHLCVRNFPCGEIINVIDHNQHVMVVGESGSWCHLSDGNWVMAQFLEKVL